MNGSAVNALEQLPEQARLLASMRGIWRGMIYRCTRESSPSWPHYGGRGIRVCDRWVHSFDDFVADVGVRPSLAHSIDRIDNDGHYEPGNVRWATRTEQAYNRRDTVWVSLEGEARSISDWSDRTGIPAQTLYGRIAAGWTHEEALSVPSKFNRRNSVLTERQLDVLAFIVATIDETGIPPSMREIGRRFGIRSTNGINDHLRALERKGALVCPARAEGRVATRGLRPTAYGRQLVGLERRCPHCGKCTDEPKEESK